MVTPKTGRPRGRPQLDFVQDPDRFAIALAFALRALGSSENAAFQAVAASGFGSKVSAEQIGPRRKRGRGAIPGGLMVTYERAAHSGAATTTLRGRATSLRHKGARIERDPKAMAWLEEKQAAFALALQSASSAELCAARILELGQDVVKGKLAEDQLLNVLSSELPDLFTNDPGQEQA
jgi:hypothetical protein